MIEKLNLEEVNNPGEATLKAFSILNQLVNAVNELQLTTSKMEKVETSAENVQDKFAEQHRWIGKLCWFWISGKNNKNHYGKLKQIDPFSKHHYTDEDLACWDFCEPVKPDDDIIYRGE